MRFQLVLIYKKMLNFPAKINLNPLVSIIIPTYNRVHFVGETLDSIIAQSYPNWECIVIDDGSVDYTVELLEFYCKRDSRISYHNRPKSHLKGPNACRNFGFKKSKGDWIKFFDSDDILVPEALSLHVENLSEQDVVITKVKYIDEEGKSINLEHHYLPVKNLVEDYFVGRITYYTFGPLWNRSFLERQPCLFDERIRNLDDWDFNLRMLYQEPRITYIHKPLILYRLHENSLSYEIKKLNYKEIRSEFQARKKHLKILKKNPKVNYLFLKEYDKNRCKKKLKRALIVKHKEKLGLYLMLSRRQLELFQLREFIITTLGFLSFSLFGKGERFLR